VPAAPADIDEHQPQARTTRALPIVVAVVVGAALVRPLVAGHLDAAGLQNWSTIFVAICVQALPFLVLGVTVSGAIAAFVPPAVLARILPRQPVLAVPVAAVAGVALPGCECGSVPIAGRLVARGVPPSAAVTFLLAAPAVNPVVLVATAVAFPGQPRVCSPASPPACWPRAWWGSCGCGGAGTSGSTRPATATTRRTRSWRPSWRRRSTTSCTPAASWCSAPPPRRRSDRGAPVRARQHRGRGLIGVLALAGLAVVLAICSEADAFVAASLPQFSLTARLAFMVVGPMVDVKLVALQAGTFGRRFTSFFAPLTFVVCVLSAIVVGWMLL
jgi:uncharacterized membrane protein YraQ (UPF0718 family)